jgi:hypothetical protein
MRAWASRRRGHAGGLAAGGQLGGVAVEGVHLGADRLVLVGDHPAGDAAAAARLWQMSAGLAGLTSAGAAA